MKVRDSGIHHVVESVQFAEGSYGSVVQVVGDESAKTELRWAKGERELESENLL